MKFHIHIDQPYAAVARVLLDSLQAFSTHAVELTAINFDFEHPHPGLTVRRLDTSSLLIHKEVLRLRLIADIQEPGIVLDADMIANWNVDELFELCGSSYTVLQPLAPCGYPGEKPVPRLGLPRTVQHYNCVPMILTRFSHRWFQNMLPSLDRFAECFREVYPGCEISDDLMLDWLRFVSQEHAYCNSCGPDRFLFDDYMGETADVMRPTGPTKPLYQDRRVSWHLFHGEKDPVRARWMLETIQARGPEFIRACPSRSRRPKAFESFLL